MSIEKPRNYPTADELRQNLPQTYDELVEHVETVLLEYEEQQLEYLQCVDDLDCKDTHLSTIGEKLLAQEQELD